MKTLKSHIFINGFQNKAKIDCMSLFGEFLCTTWILFIGDRMFASSSCGRKYTIIIFLIILSFKEGSLVILF